MIFGYDTGAVSYTHLDVYKRQVLKELNMNITEIETYRKAPSPASFLAIDDAKEKEIDRQIQKLKNIKTVMQEKKEKIVLCETL